MDTRAEAGEGDLWRGVHFSETRHDHLFINFPAVVAAVFGNLERYGYCTHAARGVAMILESSRSEAPSVMREWMSKSRDTEESPASILATRDWLDRSFAGEIHLRQACYLDGVDAR